MFSLTGICSAASSSKKTLLAVLLLFLASKEPILAQLTIGGEYELYSGVGITESLERYSLRSRVRLRGEYEAPGFMAYSAVRITNDLWDPQEAGRPGPFRARLLEAFVDLYFDNIDVRLGHQLIVWGQFDGTFITDVVSPLDLSEFLAQDFTDIRLAVPAAQASLFSGPWSITGLLTLAPMPSRIPSSKSPWFVVPDNLESISVVLDDDNLPSPGLDQLEPGLKLTYGGTTTTASLLYFFGRNRIPAFGKTAEIEGERLVVSLKPDYARRHVVGARVSSTAVESVVLEFEGAYESGHKVDVDPESIFGSDFSDLPSDDLLVDQKRLLVGASIGRTYGQTFVEAQLLGSLLTKYDDIVARDRFEGAITALVQTSWVRETYMMRLFAYWSPGADYWLNPVVTYSAGPGVNASLGMHIFGGDSPDGTLTTSAFGLFDSNDFAYARLTLAF